MVKEFVLIERGEYDLLKDIPSSNVLTENEIVSDATPGGGGTSTSFEHRIGKLTHPQTKAGPKTDPFSDYLQ